VLKLFTLVGLVVLAASAHAADAPDTRVGDFRDFPAFPSTILNNTRPVSVLLPPSYDKESERRYPVLYAQDGQNLFSERTGFMGKEWQLDETLQKMWAEKRLPEIIVVGIGNNGANRMTEYMPGSGGDKYVKFLTSELKPFIDNRFRTMKDAKNTAIMGSSMGGIISLWAAVTRSDVFAQAAGLSPSLQYAEAFESRLGGGWKPPIRAYMDMGTAEMPGPQGRQLADTLEIVRNRLKGAGWDEGKDFVANVIEGGEHNEAAWAARVDKPLTFLFAPK
jgi:predicted alpha/beta superfamily hydrolase